ncbi:sugar ABC transporter permease [Anaerocolumna cellulosilytica]|uniref:Sugar ABC transporter permease n=1 Tax=Anaerocolumna cellulosilytica TaxID=433286 RepID=A0A6S6RAJ2_9FIRM|nr:ABC transporter permease subunit [Anaerocolumna cellulosilytica]MBB5195339.1 putative aldouronate transport system permease protein [Anaerocolumna cellulosilytica]BCJ95871.1 sugar ABC transporter permease [Anaerocolumna cellulosilytica]
MGKKIKYHKVDGMMVQKPKKQKLTWNLIRKQRYLYFMSVPFIIWIIIFKYVPLWGWSMAFQNVRPKSFVLPVWEREWVGLKNFKDVFSRDMFYAALRNTLAMSGISIVLGFATAIIFALLLNELRVMRFKKLTQTISYLPHFVSWVIIASIAQIFLKDSGVLNQILMSMGIISEPIKFLSQTGPRFWFVVCLVNVWKECGWDAIIYLSAMTGIDQGLYEAAKVDGAGRFRRMWHITLPGIRPTIIVLLILSIGSVLNIGMERQMLMSNAITKDYANVLDWYAYLFGIGENNYSFGTAVGIFKSAISLLLLMGANKIANKIGEGSLV